jgi:hypothetical protein
MVGGWVCQMQRKKKTNKLTKKSKDSKFKDQTIDQIESHHAWVSSMIAATGLLQALESELRTMCADLKKKHTNIREVRDCCVGT